MTNATAAIAGVSTGFDPDEFLANAGGGRRLVYFKSNQAIFTQGAPADAIFYIQTGRVKITVSSTSGKEATLALIDPGDFIGEESIAAVTGPRNATAIALVACTALRIERREMLRVIREEPSFAELFLDYLLTRNLRTQADLIDQLFNFSEKRLARVLLQMAEFGKAGELEALIPPITQETLAGLVGTTRSRVNFFMNRFRKLGFIEYNGRIRVHKSLLNVIQHD